RLRLVQRLAAGGDRAEKHRAVIFWVWEELKGQMFRIHKGPRDLERRPQRVCRRWREHPNAGGPARSRLIWDRLSEFRHVENSEDLGALICVHVRLQVRTIRSLQPGSTRKGRGL